MSAPWERRPGETARAYSVFLVYLQLGPGRSLRRVVEAEGRPPSYLRTVARWASQHEWEARAEAWEIAQLQQSAERRRVDLERARQLAYDALIEAIETVRGVMRGEMPLGDSMPLLDRHGEQIGERPLISAATRLQAAIRLIETAGLTVPKRVELTGAEGEAIELATRTVSDLTTEQIRAIRDALEAEGDG